MIRYDLPLWKLKHPSSDLICEVALPNCPGSKNREPLPSLVRSSRGTHASRSWKERVPLTCDLGDGRGAGGSVALLSRFPTRDGFGDNNVANPRLGTLAQNRVKLTLEAGVRNWALLLARLITAGCVLPTAVAHASNISGLALAFWMKGMPVPNAVASACVIAEVFGAVFLAMGVAPRLTASVMVSSLVITTGTFHRFWDVVGAARATEQTILLGNMALVAGLIFYSVTGPGDWSWRSLWGPARSRAPRPKRATARQAAA